MKLMIIFGSSRQARKGEVVANWVKNHAQEDNRLEVDYVDCRDLNLPFFDEPLGPYTMKRQGVDYTHPEGRAWADRVGKADGVLIVTPEYNHSFTAVLKNALDWVGPEWNYKPVSFVSYGGISGGSRVVEQLRTVTIELGLMQVSNPIHFPFFERAFDEKGQPLHTDNNDKLKSMFDELVKLNDLSLRLRS
jgi:NAD(P)H-dependent FMN reductase